MQPATVLRTVCTASLAICSAPACILALQPALTALQAGAADPALSQQLLLLTATRLAASTTDETPLAMRMQMLTAWHTAASMLRDVLILAAVAQDKVCCDANRGCRGVL